MSKKAIRPVIKWTGGKYAEYKLFQDYIPEFENYYEPFFGGGGVFFQLQPKNKSFINDRSTDLMNFYKLLNDPDFQERMLFFGKAWKDSDLFVKGIQSKCFGYFDNFLHDNINEGFFKVAIFDLIESEAEKVGYEDLFSPDFICDKEETLIQIKKSIFSKLKRIKQIFIKENKEFTEEEMYEHIDVGVKSGIYTQIRTIMNNTYLGWKHTPLPHYIACWYLVREFCFSAMFRFNEKGEFNIPYGGIGYNKKDFIGKIKKLFNPDVLTLFRNAVIDNMDFEPFLTRYPPTANDFIFVDPPYDSTFSEYDNNAFGEKDQIRLRDALLNSKAKWMLVIKETKFIRDIYTEIYANIYDFDKKYMSNMRSRNDRDVKHLIITNYVKK